MPGCPRRSACALPALAWGGNTQLLCPFAASRATSTALVVIALVLAGLLVGGLCCAKRLGLHKRLCQFGKGTSCQYRTEPESQVQFLHPAERITQLEPQSYSKAPPNRPRPPQWRQNTELQLMPTTKAPGPPKPPPPQKPLPLDPLRAVSSCDPEVQMLPSRPAPPPPPTLAGSSGHPHEI
ncbi:hypothetical protein E2320_013923 [Naja naja]|nr:hypothetical protein E2320_013923 [Naja naja]